MPGPYVHMSVADKLIDHFNKIEQWNFQSVNIPNNTEITPKELADIAQNNKNYYMMGAVGPDLFFFLADFREILGVKAANPLLNVAHLVFNLYDKLDTFFLEDWERYFGPISEDVAEAISRLTGDLNTMVNDILSKLSSVLITGIADVITQTYDFWGLFSLGLNSGYDNQDFFVSDMLHYRSTSHFANSLWVLADKREIELKDGETPNEAKVWADRLRAYAIGYMSHVAADITGHAMVNEKCGGPYRTNWQRHHLIENHMDANTYRTRHGSDAIYNMFTESALHYDIAFNEDTGGMARPRPFYDANDDSMRGLYIRKRHLDLDSKMPDDLAMLLFDALDRTYNYSGQAGVHGPARGTPDIIQPNNDPSDLAANLLKLLEPGIELTSGDGRPTPENIKDTYQIFFKYLKFSTLDGFSHEKPKPPDVFPNLDFPRLTDPHDEEPGEGDSDMSLWDWALAIIRFLLWIVAVAVWLATILPAIIADLGTYPIRVLAYYTIDLPLFLLLKAERMFLVMTSYLHPMPDEIEMSLIQLGNNNQTNFLQVLADIDHILPWGASTITPVEPVPDVNYPHQHDKEQHHHPWHYPETNTEPCPTFPGPFVTGSDSDTLIADSIPGSQQIRELFQDATDPQTTDDIAFTQVNAMDNLGDPVNFSSYLAWQLARGENEINFNVTDWNMDADRGYAYKCWDWNRRTDSTSKDKDNHDFATPCTLPPQVDKKIGNYDSEKPLLIHYMEVPDPSCIPIECPKRRMHKSSGSSGRGQTIGFTTGKINAKGTTENAGNKTGDTIKKKNAKVKNIKGGKK